MGNTGPKYLGPLGQTLRRRVLYRCPSEVEVSVDVFSQINAETDPELADQLVAEGTSPLTIEDPSTGQRCPIHIRRVFHDPARELFVLVLTEAHRHRELTCRAELLTALAASPEATVPDYVRSFDVVYGGAGIAAIIEARLAQRELDNARAEESKLRGSLAKRESELEARSSEVQNIESELSQREAELARSRADVARERSEIARERSRLVSQESPNVVASTPRQAPAGHRETQKGFPQMVPAAIGLATSDEANDTSDVDVANTSPFDRVSLEVEPGGPEDETYLEPYEDEEVQGEEVFVTDQPNVPPATDTGDASTRVGGAADVAIERWISSREPSLATIDDAGAVRLAVSLPERSLEGLLSQDLKVMLQLHTMQTYPLVTLSVGRPEGFSKGRPAPATFHFNIGETSDRAVVSALAEDFTFMIDLFDTEYLPVRKRSITGGLAANAHYVLAAADDLLAKVKKRTEPSYTRALLAYDAPNYDRFGRLHPERKEFREDVLTSLSEPPKVRWAIHVCRRFSTPEGQEYLFQTRGYPIALWQARRRAVIRRAAELGLWMGNTLAGIAVSEGVAGSRKELIEAMARNFVDAVSGGNEHGLDEDTVRDNWTALTEELRAQGFDPGTFVSPRSEAISSELQDVASGTIGRVTALSLGLGPDGAGGGGGSGVRQLANGTLSGKSTDELVALLGDRDRRYEAALELCRSSTPAAIRPLFSALRRMTRAEAGHVFGGVVGFGEAAVPHLIETLGSRKGFLRQGAALALSALGSPSGLEPVCNLLVSEPTDIWKEVARALGEYGPTAVMPLCTHLRGGSEVAHERIAWALAHIASRGDRIAIDTLAGGRDAVAAGVARHAIELSDLARSDNRSIWNPRPGREHTVKRAFSKRVFEAMPKSPRGTSEVSTQAMALTEADLLDASDLEEEVEQLDESDLLPN